MDLLAPTAGETVATLPEGPASDAAGAPALRYRVWEELTTPPRATLAVLSGVMSNTAWFRPLADAWRGMGYRVIGLERRGSGLNHHSARPRTTADGGPDAAGEDTPSAEALLDDAARELEHGRAPGRPVVIVGWCWGAILAVHLALRLEGSVQGLALLTPGIHPSAALSERMRALAEQAKALPPQAPVLESPITDEMFTAGPALDGFIRRDESRWRSFSPRFLDVSTRLSLAARLRLRKLALPVFVALAEDDVTTDNAAILAELARLPPDRVRTTLMPGPHGLQFDAPQALAERLDAWAHQELDTLGV
jgi:pimeloyl-ACP methyl ester carboxylesterase